MMFLLHRIHTRYSAALLHFLVSLSVFAILVGILLLVWYPAAYFSAAGGWQGLQLLAAVDLVLGPLITLIIYNPEKSRRELRVDIFSVVALQLIALVLGIKAVYEQRPVAVVFLDTSFYTVPALAISSQGIPLADLSRYGDSFPVYVYAERPESGPEFERFVQAVDVQRIPPHEQVPLYRPLSENFSRVIRSSLDVAEIMASNADMREQFEDLQVRTGIALNEMHAIALTSRYRNIVLMFDASGRLMGTVSAPYKSGDL